MFKKMTTNMMVENVEESISFYTGILGFSLVASVPGKQNGLQFAIVSRDGLSLMFQEKSNLIEEYPILDTLQVKPSVSIYISVDSFDELYRDIKDKHPLLCDIHTTFYGNLEFAIADNSGYVLTFTEYKE